MLNLKARTYAPRSNFLRRKFKLDAHLILPLCSVLKTNKLQRQIFALFRD